MGKRKDKGEKLFATVFGGDDVKAVFEVVKELAGVAETFLVKDVFDHLETTTDENATAILHDMATDGLVSHVNGNVHCPKQSPIMQRELQYRPLVALDAMPDSKYAEATRLLASSVLKMGGKPVAHWPVVALEAAPFMEAWNHKQRTEVRRMACKLGIFEFVGKGVQGHVSPALVPISKLFSQLRNVDLDKSIALKDEEGDRDEQEDDGVVTEALITAVRGTSSMWLFVITVWLLAGQKTGVKVPVPDVNNAWKKFGRSRDGYPRTASRLANERGCVTHHGRSTGSAWSVNVSPIETEFERYAGPQDYVLSVKEAAAVLGIELTGESIEVIDGVTGSGDVVTVLTVSTVAFWRMLWLLAGEQVNGVVDRKLACESWKWLSELVDLIADLVDPLVRAGVIEVDNGNIRIMLDPDGDEFSYVVKDGVTPPTFDEIREALVAGALEPKPHSVASAVLEPTGVDMSGLQIDELFELIKAVVGAKDRIEAFLLAKYQQMTFEQLRSVVAELGSFGVNLQMHGKAVHGTASAFDDMLVIKQAHAKIHAQEREVAASLEKLFAPVSEE